MTTTTAKRTVPDLAAMARQGEKIAMLTCYDASFAVLLDRAGVDALLVGDSLGMVIGGHASTLPVTLDEMVYHTRCVAARRAHSTDHRRHVVRQLSGKPRAGVRSAVRLMAAGAQMVKLEGGAWLAPTVEFLVARGIPVCGHLGLQPQSVHRLGGYRVQGKTDASAQTLREDTRALAQAGIDLLVLEMVPAAAGRGAHRRASACRRSASAPVRVAAARCWSCTICSASTRASRRDSCAIS